MKTLLALLSIATLLACAATYNQQTQVESDDLRDESDESSEIFQGQQVDQSDKYESVSDVSTCYGIGKIKSDNPCSLCYCKNGQKSCARISCNETIVPRNCQKVKEEGKCCPVIKCPEISGPVQKPEYGALETEAECQGNGPIFSDNPCSVCFCRNGIESCTRQSCNHTIPRGCKEVEVPGKCCPEINCPEISPPGQKPDYGREVGGADCQGSGPIFSDNPCSLCSCKNGKKVCMRRSCDNTVPKGCKEVKVPGKCCPEINCPEISPPDETPRDDPDNRGRCFGEGIIPNPNPCNRCSCINGRRACPAWHCPNRPSAPHCKLVNVPDQCCPIEKCDKIAGTTRPSTECTGDGYLPSPNSCTSCRCKNGFKSCVSVRCQQVIATPNCKVKRLPGVCCPTLECQKDENPVDIGSITGCERDGPKPSSDPCNRCFCRNGNLQCSKRKCPPVEPGCVARRNPGQCCPKIECSGVKY